MLGGVGIQSAQHTDPATRQSIYHPTPAPCWIYHHMAEESALLHPDLYHWELTDTMDPLHLHLSAADR